MAKSSPNLTKFCRHDHKGLVNISTEEIDESLHDLGGIEGLPSKNGVFSRTQKLRFERARESGVLYCVKSDRFTTKSSEKYYDLVLHEHINENQISSQTRHKTYEIETKSNTPRAQGGKGLLSRSISIQESQKSMVQILP